MVGSSQSPRESNSPTGEDETCLHVFMTSCSALHYATMYAFTDFVVELTHTTYRLHRSRTTTGR